MKLYRKQLNSVEELKREKIRLRYERMHTKASDLNPIAEVGGNKKNASSVNNFLGLVMSMLGSGSTIDKAAKLAPVAMSFLGKRRKSKEDPHHKSFGQKLVTEILVAYAIGKGVQMGVRALKLYLRSRKRKREIEHEIHRLEKKLDRGW